MVNLVGALLLFAATAGGAGLAGVDHAADADLVADLDLGHGRAHLGADPRELMAGDAGVGLQAQRCRVALGRVQVGVAHPCDREAIVGNFLGIAVFIKTAPQYFMSIRTSKGPTGRR